MYALVEYKGKQYKAEKGAVLTVDKLDAEKGAKIDVDSVLTAQVTDGKRHFGSRTQVVKQIYFDAVGREDVG